MKIKELQKVVNIAWSPSPQQPIYLATGTAAQQFDSNANSVLDIYSTNFSDPSYDLELKVSLNTKYKFHKLIWSPTGFGAVHQKGLIVGGCEKGHVMVYSPGKMFSHEDGLIACQDKHSGPVSGLDFNPFQMNLLASCASESEVFIWDLNNTTTHMNPGAKTQPSEDVKNVSWNRQVQHILASVFSSRCVIWDLRKSEQIIKLSDTQSRVRWHSIQWHPEMATQVWLASEDDQAPVMQLWDLRYATAPAKTVQIHQRGVLGMSWCPRDSDLMVSCGKDNRIYCWNPNSQQPEGEILSEVAITASWYSDVQWCPRNPALIASSSLDGNVSIYSLFGGTQQQVQTSNKIADSFPGMDQFAQAPVLQQLTPVTYKDLKYAPKWLKQPVGAFLGFGGKLVSFNNKRNVIVVQQLITEPILVEKAQMLEKSLNETNYVEYCRKRADEMTDRDDRYLWYFIKANFERNPKEEMLNLLGFNKEDIEGKFAKYVPNGDLMQPSEEGVQHITNRMAKLDHQRTNDNISLFHDIAAVAQKQAGDTSKIQKPPKQFKIPRGEDVDSLITEAIITGNIEAAVELCFNNNHIPEALIIASTGGTEFLAKTQNRFLQQQQQQQENDISYIISALVTRDWMNFVTHCAVDSWKEALVATLRHCDRKVVDICEKLGDRLLADRSQSVEYARNAMLCYVCAGNLDKLVLAWYQLKRLEHQNAQYKLNTEELQTLAEIVMLMNKSLEEQGVTVELNNKAAEFISEYGGILVAQGAFSTALTYLMEIKACSMHIELDDLRQRISNILQPRARPAVQQEKTMQHQNVGYAQQQPPPPPQPNVSFSYNSGIPNITHTGTPVGPTVNTYQSPTTWNSSATMNETAPKTSVGSNNKLNPVAGSTTFKPLICENVPHPPRPLSTASSQDGATKSGSSLHTRSKYILDPSVAASGTSATSGYGNIYNSPPLQFNTNPNHFNTMQLNNNTAVPAPFSDSNVMSTSYNASAFSNTAYVPGVSPIETTTGPPPFQNIQRNPPPPPGWNDPPSIQTTRQTKKVESAQMFTAPITHPLFGVDPNQNENGYMDSFNQNQKNLCGMPPPPPTASMNSSTINATQTNQRYLSGGATSANDLTSMNFKTAAIPVNQNVIQEPHNTGDLEHRSQPQPSLTRKSNEITAIQAKPPLPVEFVYLQTVLEELKNQCLSKATDPRTKRKFVDVVKRLETLYDCLRDSRLTTTTIQALNQIVQFLQVGDYTNALQCHTQIAFGTDFSQCAGFMPGLKVLIQCANELQISLQ